MFGLGFLGLGRGGRAGTRDPFDFESGRGSSNHYDLSGLAGGGGTMLSLPPALQSYSAQELKKLKNDSRDLQLGPANISEGIAMSYDGRFSAIIEAYATDFSLTTEEDQDRAVSGLHSVLLQLNSDFDYQIKNRVVEADLQPVVDSVEYTQRVNETTQRWNQTARDYKAFLRNLSGRFSMMERHNYIIISYRSTKLAAMEVAFQARTGRHSHLFDPLGLEETTLLSSLNNSPTKKGKGKGKGKKGKQAAADRAATINLITERQEQQARLRIEREMEAKIFEEKGRVTRLLENEVRSLINSLAANGLFTERLNDWQVMAFYADYLKPELAEQARIGMQQQQESVEALAAQELVRGLYQRADGGSGGLPNPSDKPLSLGEFLGNQSSTVVVGGVRLSNRMMLPKGDASSGDDGGDEDNFKATSADNNQADDNHDGDEEKQPMEWPPTPTVAVHPDSLPPLSVRVLRDKTTGRINRASHQQFDQKTDAPVSIKEEAQAQEAKKKKSRSKLID